MSQHDMQRSTRARTLIGLVLASGAVTVGLATGYPPHAVAEPVGAAGEQAEAEFLALAIATNTPLTILAGLPPDTPPEDVVKLAILQGYLDCEITRAVAQAGPVNKTPIFSIAQPTLCPDVIAPVAAPPAPPAGPPLDIGPDLGPDRQRLSDAQGELRESQSDYGDHDGMFDDE
jgi:hypothetical protein